MNFSLKGNVIYIIIESDFFKYLRIFAKAIFRFLKYDILCEKRLNRQLISENHNVFHNI